MKVIEDEAHDEFHEYFSKGKVKFKSGCSSLCTRLQFLQVPHAVFVSQRSMAASLSATGKGSSPGPPEIRLV